MWYNYLGDKMQINRLFQILYILLNKKTVTSKELARELEVSTRTIYRDIEVLSSCNIPIFMTKGKNGGISILEDFVFNKTLLSSDEQNKILEGLATLKLTPNNEDILLNKLSNLFNKENRTWLEIDFSSWGSDNKEIFEKLKSSILNKNLIEFDYYNSYGSISRRTVEPLQIYFKDKSWYLRANDIKKGFRLFKINRIKNLNTLHETFSNTIIPDIPQDKKNISSLVTVKLWISKDLAYRVYDEFQPQNITKSSEEDFIVEVTYPEDSWVYGYILSFGSKAKVISPSHIKDIITKELQKSLENYF